MEDIIPVLRSTIVIMSPLLFAATGGLFPALAGMLNIALEGLMLVGAFSALAAYCYTGNIFIALLAAITASLALSAIQGFVPLRQAFWVCRHNRICG